WSASHRPASTRSTKNIAASFRLWPRIPTGGGGQQRMRGTPPRARRHVGSAPSGISSMTRPHAGQTWPGQRAGHATSSVGHVVTAAVVARAGGGRSAPALLHEELKRDQAAGLAAVGGPAGGFPEPDAPVQHDV